MICRIVRSSTSSCASSANRSPTIRVRDHRPAERACVAASRQDAGQRVFLGNRDARPQMRLGIFDAIQDDAELSAALGLACHA